MNVLVVDDHGGSKVTGHTSLPLDEKAPPVPGDGGELCVLVCSKHARQSKRDSCQARSGRSPRLPPRSWAEIGLVLGISRQTHEIGTASQRRSRCAVRKARRSGGPDSEPDPQARLDGDRRWEKGLVQRSNQGAAGWLVSACRSMPDSSRRSVCARPRGRPHPPGTRA